MNQPGDGLTAVERINVIKQVFSFLSMLYGPEEGLAGVILTDSAFDAMKKEFGSAAIPYAPAEINIDPSMEHSFHVNGLLFLRGTPNG